MKKIKDEKPTYITKIVCYSLFVLLVIIGLILVPKELMNYDEVYSFATSAADINENTLVMYDYKVYGTENRFNQGLDSDVLSQLSTFKERGEILLVKIYGEDENLVYKEDYWLQTSGDVVELNIEYYIVPNIRIQNNSLPSRSILLLVKDVLVKIDVIYTLLIILFSLLILCPSTIGIIRAVIDLTKLKKEKTEE